jgi:hypothetical protein
MWAVRCRTCKFNAAAIKARSMAAAWMGSWLRWVCRRPAARAPYYTRACGAIELRLPAVRMQAGAVSRRPDARLPRASSGLCGSQLRSAAQLSSALSLALELRAGLTVPCQGALAAGTGRSLNAGTVSARWSIDRSARCRRLSRRARRAGRAAQHSLEPLCACVPDPKPPGSTHFKCLRRVNY